MSVRSAQLREPVLRLRLPDGPAAAEIVSIEGRRVFVRTEAALEAGQVINAEWSGPGRILVQVEVQSVSATGPDMRHGVSLALQRAGSHEGEEALTRFLTGRLGLHADSYQIVHAGESCWVALEDAVTAAPAPAPGPAADRAPARVAGVRHDAPAAPLDTGRGPTTVESLREYLTSSGAGIGVYVNAPCAYVLAGAPYWGRALRLNDRFLQVNTSHLVPGLGVRLRCDLTVEVDGVKRAVSFFGIMTQKKDPPVGTMYKATLMVRIHRIDEGDSPGLLVEFLERAGAPDPGNTDG